MKNITWLPGLASTSPGRIFVRSSSTSAKRGMSRVAIFFGQFPQHCQKAGTIHADGAVAAIATCVLRYVSGIFAFRKPFGKCFKGGTIAPSVRDSDVPLVGLPPAAVERFTRPGGVRSIHIAPHGVDTVEKVFFRGVPAVIGVFQGLADYGFPPDAAFCFRHGPPHIFSDKAGLALRVSSASSPFLRR